MTRRITYAVAGGLLFTLACGSAVEIGHGGPGGSGGSAGSSDRETGGTDNPVAEGGSIVVQPTGGTSFIEGGSNDVANSGTASTTGGTSNDPGLVGAPGPVDNGPQAEVGKVDLLIAVDNSISMAEKQQLFAQTVPELVKRLISPYCVSTTGTITSQPATPDTACPEGSSREFEPLADLHVGVITSSLGSHGASGAQDVCVNASDNDHAHLLPFVRQNLSSYDGRGYLNWDPQGVSTPPGESDVQAFSDSLQNMITAVGEQGCGYEAQLESVYRFLVDPEPPKSLSISDADQTSHKVGVDQELITERANFLRPDSSVVVLMLTDENDCSIQDGGYGYLIARTAPMFRSTSECATNPNDPCCQSCAESSRNPGCAAFSVDSECQKGVRLSPADDDFNLRCFNQKGRFGFDLLYPTARYVNGFSDGKVPNQAGQLVANPLFHQGNKARDPSLFTLGVIAGVPWQDIATSASLSADTLEYQTADQLTANGRWAVVLGDPSTNTSPTDPFMRESVVERSGKNPITRASITPSSSTDPQANAINGHEYDTQKSDLQFACTFELPEPLLCDQQANDNGQGCDCFMEELPANRPLCNPPGGGAAGITQYYGKAYPAARELSVAQGLGRRTVLGSICARNTQDDTASDYGYRPVFGALGRRLASTLVKP